jgi:hypothetical protein
VTDNKGNQKDNDFQRVILGVLFIFAGSVVAILALIGGIGIIGIIIAIILIAIGYYIIAFGKQTPALEVAGFSPQK